MLEKQIINQVHRDLLALQKWNREISKAKDRLQDLTHSSSHYLVEDFSSMEIYILALDTIDDHLSSVAYNWMLGDVIYSDANGETLDLQTPEGFYTAYQDHVNFDMPVEIEDNHLVKYISKIIKEANE